MKPLLLAALLLVTSCSPSKKEENEVDSIYNSLSQEERVAQLYGIRSTELIDEEGNLDVAKCDSLIPHGVGHVSQFACMLHLEPNKMRNFVRDLQNYIIAHNAAGVPAIFHEEAITGVSTLGATTYPQQIGVACSWNSDLVELKSQYTSQSMRALGGQMALSPMVDVVRTQHFNRSEESYGEDGYLSSVFAYHFVRGLQGDDLTRNIAATTKHFLGYGGGSELTEKELYEEIIMPHEVAIQMAGSRALMPGYHSFEGETAISNPYFLKELLRGYLGFDGLVVSDYSAISLQWGITAQDLPLHLYKRGVKAMNAGADLELCNGLSYPLLPEMMEKGDVTPERFEEAVKRNLQLKVELGMMEKDARFCQEGTIDLNKKEYVELAYTLAAQSVVLLKNSGVLPLDKNNSKIALVGPNANSYWAMLGDYTYQSLYAFWTKATVDPTNPKIYTLKEGMELALGTSQLNYERGVDWDDSYTLSVETGGDDRVSESRLDHLVRVLRREAEPTDWNKAIAVAKRSDVVIAAVGENAALCGEGRLRKGIRLPGEQEAFVEQLIDSGKDVVVVLFGGRNQPLSKKIVEGAAAIVQAWYPGQEGGRAVADILFGDVNPSAKLAMSYPLTESEEPICYNYGEAMGSLVAYPFGYGLSYTTFDYSDVAVTREAAIAQGTTPAINVSVNVTNTGERSGCETVQLYLSAIDKGDKFKPLQLKGFARVELAPGESRRVAFSLAPEMMAYFDVADHLWHLEGGDYELIVASSSSDHRGSGVVTLTGEPCSMKRRSCYLSEAKVLD